MFSQRLDEEQSKQLRLLAAKMVMADGKIVKSESIALEDLVRETGGDTGSVPDPDLSIFDTRESRVILALEALMLALVDGDYHVRENALFNRTCAELELTPTEVEAISLLAARAARLMAEVNRICAKPLD